MKMETITLHTKYPKKMVIPTMHQVFDRENALILVQIERLKKEIKHFEDKYNMASEDFYKNFEEGKIGDTQDFFMWASSIDIHKRLKDKHTLLEEFTRQCKI